jgi:hypothetical protein
MHIDDAAGNMCQAPRHRMPFISRYEGSHRVLMTRRAVSARPCHKVPDGPQPYLQPGPPTRSRFTSMLSIMSTYEYKSAIDAS